MEKKPAVVASVLSFALAAVLAWAGSGEVDTPVRPTAKAPADPPLSSAPAPAEGTRLAVTYAAGRLAVKAREVPLGDVLRAVGDAAGVRFESSEAVIGPVSIDTGAQPLRQAIGELLARTDYSFAYVEAQDGATAQVLLARRGVAVNPPSRVAPPTHPAVPDEAALQQQRATDAMFEACKASACDSS